MPDGKNGSGKSGVMGILNLSGMVLEPGLKVDDGLDAVKNAYIYIFKRSSYLYVVKVLRGFITGLWQASQNINDNESTQLNCVPINRTSIVDTWYYASNNLQLSFSGSKLSRHDLSIAYRRRNKSHAGPEEVFYCWHAMKHLDLKDWITARVYTWRVQKSWYQKFGDIELALPSNNELRKNRRYVAILVSLRVLWAIIRSYEKNAFFWRMMNKEYPDINHMIPNYKGMLEAIGNVHSESSAMQLFNEFRPLCEYFFSVTPEGFVSSLVEIQRKNINNYGTVYYQFPQEEDNHFFLSRILSAMSRIKENASESRFTIDPPFSTGEWKLIDLYATLQRKANEAKTKDNHVQLLLDEPDSDLHPDLQTRLINTILNLLSDSSKCRFQLIISSHNPIVVSDLPSASVIPVDPSSSVLGKTFGSNIYDLYKHRFFVERSAGEFASNKIRSALKDDGIDEKTLRFLIAEAGEPLLVRALQRRLGDANRIANRDIEQFVAQLTEEQREVLKGKLNEE
ncbi:hypothetical protein FEI17_10200 [Kosakonia radicincitans]|uniref:AAA family ATPase n=1 Tax=Kosakonia radicincitans TaxID=283686 RepID=UPI0011ECCA49|nr:AAA family ATPase [Kosakonia radicincitans]QEM90985.1 hypothetical protein FEI17_10200 [Kosakonia radicincitans]